MCRRTWRHWQRRWGQRKRKTECPTRTDCPRVAIGLPFLIRHLAMARRMHSSPRERTMNNPLRLTLSVMITSMGAFAGSVSLDLKALNPSTPVRVVIQFIGTPSTGALAAIKADGGVLY